MIFIAKRQIITLVFILILCNESKSQNEPCFTDVNDIQIASYNENSIFVHPVYPYILINANNANGININYSTNSGQNRIECIAQTGGGPDPSVAIDISSYNSYYNSIMNSNEQKHKIVRNKFTDRTDLTPNEFKLHQNYPNPFNLSTLIKYDLKINSDVSIIIYDLLGKEVKSLVNENQNAGYWNVI